MRLEKQFLKKFKNNYKKTAKHCPNSECEQKTTSEKGKLVDITEKVNSKNSGRKNHRWRRRIKKIAGQVLTYNSKNFP